MKAKPSVKRKKHLVNFRLTPAQLATLSLTAEKLRRTKNSIIEQLLEQYCTTKNLQP
jgi:hypothetical protein